jgi:very-short-patch-repair endonuclease
MPRAKDLPPQLDRSGFRVRTALEAGVDPGRLRRRDLVRPVHGVRAGNASIPLVEAVALVMRPDQYCSHTTAAALWGAPLPRGHDSVVHVTTMGSGPLMRRPHVVGHRRRVGAQVVERSGVRVSSPQQAWRECAGVLSLRQLVAVGDHLVGRSGLASLDDLASTVAPGGRTVLAARAALELVRVGAESAMETWLRLAVVDAGFPEPGLQVEVTDSTGRFLGRVDMAWPEYRIALEYDGDHHRERPTFEHDQRRDNGMTVNGWLVLHANRADAGRPAVLFERLRQAFAARRAAS